ncbi:MAG: GNAT family N-acetyltransferase [Saprospiraceae bacterium]
MYTIQTERLGLRNWKPSDFDLFAEMTADKEVMEFFPKTLSKDESYAIAKRFMDHFDEYGFCYFAVETLADQQFIGFIGLMHQTYESYFTPCVDIGWRLRKSAWGNGYATEGAKACLEFANHQINLPEVYAVAPKLNIKSQKVMQKIGMEMVGDFEHPNVEKESPLRFCNLYKITFGKT